MLAICALLLLSSIAVAKHLRSNNDILPLNVLFEDTDHVGYTFIQDPLHPHKKGSIALQLSYTMPPISEKTFYLCESKIVHRYREDNHIMIETVNYEVSRHRKDRFLLLTQINTNTVVKLMEANQTRRCMPDMTPVHDLSTNDFGVVTPAAPKNQLMGVASSNVNGSLNAEYFSTRTGVTLSTGLLELSPAAAAACPSCTYLVGWDGEHHWFTNYGYSGPYDVAFRFVNAQTGTYVGLPVVLNTFGNAKVSKNYLLVHGFAAADGRRYVQLYNKIDGSLHRQLPFPRPLVNSYMFGKEMFLSPDETRVLFICKWSFNDLQGKSPLNIPVKQRATLVEVSVDTGAVLQMRSLPYLESIYSYYTGDRISADSIVMKVIFNRHQIYKYPA